MVWSTETQIQSQKNTRRIEREPNLSRSAHVKKNLDGRCQPKKRKEPRMSDGMTLLVSFDCCLWDTAGLVWHLLERHCWTCINMLLHCCTLHWHQGSYSLKLRYHCCAPRLIKPPAQISLLYPSLTPIIQPHAQISLLYAPLSARLIQPHAQISLLYPSLTSWLIQPHAQISLLYTKYNLLLRYHCCILHWHQG
jgi:hypothetical protein